MKVPFKVMLPSLAMVGATSLASSWVAPAGANPSQTEPVEPADHLCSGGPWDGPKKIGSAIRATVTFACPSFGDYVGWIGTLQKWDGNSWEAYGSSENGDCSYEGDIAICVTTDGAPYAPGRYRLEATQWGYGIGGWHNKHWSSAVTIK